MRTLAFWHSDYKLVGVRNIKVLALPKHLAAGAAGCPTPSGENARRGIFNHLGFSCLERAHLQAVPRPGCALRVVGAQVAAFLLGLDLVELVAHDAPVREELVFLGAARRVLVASARAPTSAIALAVEAVALMRAAFLHAGAIVCHHQGLEGVSAASRRQGRFCSCRIRGGIGAREAIVVLLLQPVAKQPLARGVRVVAPLRGCGDAVAVVPAGIAVLDDRPAAARQVGPLGKRIVVRQLLHIAPDVLEAAGRQMLPPT